MPQEDPKERLQAIGDARIEIGELLERPSQPTVSARSRRRVSGWRPALIGVTLIVGVLASALAMALWTKWQPVQPANRPLLRLNVDLGPDEPLATEDLGAAISPDGRRLVWSVRGTDGTSQLATRLLERAQPT